MKKIGLAGLFLVLSACDHVPPAPVIVYLPGDDSSPLIAQFAAFTEETGIGVEPHFGASKALTDDVIAKRGSPPADVLITSNTADIWRAAEEGALRPIKADALDAIADVQKDPDGYWAGVRVHLHFVVSRDGDGTSAWDTFGTPELAGRLCLSTSNLAASRSLVAFLVNDRGVREAERLVRRWVRNLALPPFASQDALLAAVRDGRCEYAFATSHGNLDGLTAVSPKPHYFDVSAVGVARHAVQADSAQRLVGWLLENQTDYFKGETDLRAAGIAGRHDEDARLLVERAGYR